MSEQVEKILVVDDDARLRGLLQRFLEEQGYAVKAVADADQMDRALSREGEAMARPGRVGRRERMPKQALGSPPMKLPNTMAMGCPPMCPLM